MGELILAVIGACTLACLIVFCVLLAWPGIVHVSRRLVRWVPAVDVWLGGRQARKIETWKLQVVLDEARERLERGETTRPQVTRRGIALIERELAHRLGDQR